MKKIQLIIIAFLCSISVFAGADVTVVITNNSKQVMKYNGEDGDWNKGFVRDHIPNGIDIEIGQSTSHTFTTTWGCGVDGWICYKSADGKGVMYIHYDNPSIGSSEYSTDVNQSNYQCRITSINSDVNPQIVYVEITGGDETPPKPRYALTTNGKNTITGTIEWNDLTQGYPTTNNWAEIFAIKCTVPKAFQVADNGNVIYNGERGYYMGSVQSGTVLFSNYEVLPNNLNRLSFSVINVADNLILNNFDIEIKDGNVWHAPVNSNPPAPTYLYFAGTVLTTA
jgi:hypothetical protein